MEEFKMVCETINNSGMITRELIFEEVRKEINIDRIDVSNVLQLKLEVEDRFTVVLGTSDYIEEQSGDLKNKERKLYILDQYYRILRYKNDGRIYTSGRKLNIHDCNSLILPLDRI